MAYVMSGEGFPTTYTDISQLLDFFPDEEEVMLELHSCGGDTTEGWAIYDALRASGRTIHAKVVGECASMATILFLSAPKERRSIAKHGKMLIHSPYFPDAGEVTRSNIDSLKAMLEEEHNKMLDTYVERTGVDREILENQMNNGGWFDADKAVELGFAGFIAPELSAKVNKTKSMKKNKLKAAFEAFVQAFSASALIFTTKDGQELELEKEEGDIEVGDAADPDGEFELEDGRIITVKGGVVVDIKQAEEEQPEEEAPETEAVEEPAEEAPAEDVEELKKQIEELKKENEELKKKLEEQEEVVAAVDALGGKKFLAQQSSKQLTIARKATEKKKAEEDNPYAAILAAKREALKKKK